MSEIFSSEVHGKFPNHDELAIRLKSIETCINNEEKIRQVSIEFCRRAFSLLADCDLITESIVRFLSSAEACEKYDPNLKFPYNKTEGVLRKVTDDNDVYDSNGHQRFYRGDKMHVVCGGAKYLIANNWFGDPPESGRGLPANRRAFYAWVALQTTAVVNR